MPAACRATLSDTIWAEDTFVTHKTPVGCGATVIIDGVVSFSSATHEIGNGVRTVMTQIASDASGLPLDRVIFLSGDSAFPDAQIAIACGISAVPTFIFDGRIVLSGALKPEIIAERLHAAALANAER
jgi:CO/xanthine dehydrogenase Mo-binding subunit